MKRVVKPVVLFILAAVIVIPAVVIGIEIAHESAGAQPSVPVANVSEQIARGSYLARAGNCMACHTARGGKEYAGGRNIATPFGNIYSPNVTPDAETGIGKWTSDDFWRAIHNGKSRDGSFLYPAFPYTNYTKVTRADSDAMFAYFKTLTPVTQPNKEHELRFPYNQRMLLGVWRALYFRPGEFRPEPGKSVEWNRGAYLVQGLGHCSACHTSRNALGASDVKAELAGGMIPMLNWYASPLTSDAQAGLGEWEIAHIADLLKTGVSERGVASGPMAEVVSESLQYLTDGDVSAMAIYLKSLPQAHALSKLQSTGMSAQLSGAEAEAVLKLGANLYEKHCVECHQADGEGKPLAYPSLSGNRSHDANSTINAIRMVLNGGFPPSTGGNPRPFGMPPFGPELNDREVAAVVSYINNSWGNRAGTVSPSEVGRYRGVPVE
jgi:mono/diheme cytochrome c family protein